VSISIPNGVVGHGGPSNAMEKSNVLFCGGRTEGRIVEPSLWGVAPEEHVHVKPEF